MQKDTATRSQSVNKASSPRCRPFLKWVGGKSQLLAELLARVPEDFGTYHEPFLGGGALYFALQPPTARLSDLNEELVNTYQVLKNDADLLVSALEEHRYEKEHFYRIRALDREDAFKRLSPVQRAARFIFLNKTCFNGLYRVNAKGQFNTPFGRYKNPTILDRPNLERCSTVLQSASLSAMSFTEILSAAEPEDFVYFDPPYDPVSSSASFTGYQGSGFDLQMQEALHDVCRKLDKKGVRFLASNSASQKMIELYEDFTVEKVSAKRTVNSVASKRGAVAELLISNFR